MSLFVQTGDFFDGLGFELQCLMLNSVIKAAAWQMSSISDFFFTHCLWNKTLPLWWWRFVKFALRLPVNDAHADIFRPSLATDGTYTKLQICSCLPVLMLLMQHSHNKDAQLGWRIYTGLFSRTLQLSLTLRRVPSLNHIIQIIKPGLDRWPADANRF